MSTMKHFEHDGVTLAYLDTGTPEPGAPVSGDGAPVLLIHGFASNTRINWVGPGWVDALTRAGYRVISVDNRGHGDSEKLYDSALYSAPMMAEDARALLDHLDIEHANVMGYSMGARITAFLAMTHPGRVRSAVFGGLGENMIHGVGGAAEIVAALEADDAGSIADPQARMFREFAEKTGGDRLALAACMRSSRVKIREDALAQLRLPVLVCVGTEDDIAGSPQVLADVIPGARAVDIPGREHNRAVGDKVYKQAVLDFLAERP